MLNFYNSILASSALYPSPKQALLELEFHPYLIFNPLFRATI